MSERWIFQDIKDLQENVLYQGNYVRDSKVWDENWDKYVAALQEKVSPEVFTMYQVWLCDLDVWLTPIVMCVRGIYPDVNRAQVERWVAENLEEHHCVFR